MRQNKQLSKITQYMVFKAFVPFHVDIATRQEYL